MSSVSHNEIQKLELRRLLEKSAADPILAPQLEHRLKMLETLIESEGAEGAIRPELPRAAIFLRGGGVLGSQGVRPSLAGDSLIQYEKMFIEQALHDEREAAKDAGRSRRPRGSLMPGLLFVGTPRGSFGLEFTPSPSVDEALLKVHAQSMENVANAIAAVASESEVGWVEPIPPGVLQPLRKFLKVLAQNGAELRLSMSGGKAKSLAVSDISRAVERLEKEVVQQEILVEGEFRGLAMESGVFDIRDKDGRIISGHAADSLSDEELEKIYQLLNSPCTFTLVETTVFKSGVPSPPTYVLLTAEKQEASPA